MFFRTGLFLTLCIWHTLFAGVVVLVEVPVESKALLEDSAKVVESVASQAGYTFQQVSYSAHITLAFVSQERVTVKSFLENNPELESDLKVISNQYKKFDISSSIAYGAIDCWQGTFEIDYNDKKIKNYYNIVLKLKDSSELFDLAQAIRTILEEKYKIKQAFPFSAHITIGRVFEENGQEVSPDIVDQLKKSTLSEFLVSGSVVCLVNLFKLQGEENTFVLFNLSE